MTSRLASLLVSWEGQVCAGLGLEVALRPALLLRPLASLDGS